jgi:calcineurin-like phosphoesterase family protein
MATFFTADTHFGHHNIIGSCQRPFRSVAEMDGALIANWNAVVRSTDEVWHLGDFAFSKDGGYIAGVFARLNGRKHIVLGNHDHRHTQALPWASVQRLVGIKLDKRLIVLCHYAMRTWPSAHYGSLHLYGHSHGKLPGTPQSCDIGVDCWDYRPVSLDEIRARLAATAGERP